MRNMKFVVLLVFAVFSLVGIVSAGPLPTLGGPISFHYNGDLVVTYVDQDAGYNNAFGIYTGDPLAPVQLGNIHGNNPAVEGTQYHNYRCTKDIPVVLYIKNPDNNIFRSDIPGGDGFVHAKITEESGTFTVGFEDVLGTGADWDYNDVILSVACTPDPTPPTPTPEFPTLALPVGLIIGMLGAVLFIQKTKE